MENKTKDVKVNKQMKVVSSYEEAYKVVNGITIDLDQGIEYLMDFNSKTVELAKKFKKKSRAWNGKDPVHQQQQIIKFMKNELYTFFKTSFLDKFYPNKEYEVLPKDDIAIYIFGSFVEGHAKTTNIDITVQFKLLIIELTNRIYAELIKQGQEAQKES